MNAVQSETEQIKKLATSIKKGCFKAVLQLRRDSKTKPNTML